MYQVTADQYDELTPCFLFLSVVGGVTSDLVVVVFVVAVNVAPPTHIGTTHPSPLPSVAPARVRASPLPLSRSS